MQTHSYHHSTSHHNREFLGKVAFNIPLVLQQAVLVFHLHTTEFQGGQCQSFMEKSNRQMLVLTYIHGTSNAVLLLQRCCLVYEQYITRTVTSSFHLNLTFNTNCVYSFPALQNSCLSSVVIKGILLFSGFWVVPLDLL